MAPWRLLPALLPALLQPLQGPPVLVLAMKTHCPVGYYRDSAIIWDCSGSTDRVWFFMEASGEPVGVALESGVIDFKGRAQGNLDVDLRLWDPGTKSFILKLDGDSIVNDHHHSGEYSGLQITYSGDSKGTLPVRENITTVGSVPSRIFLYFHNNFQKEGFVQLNYSYNGVSPCPTRPLGCSLYDESDAEAHVRTWSRWVQSHYASPADAWKIMCRVKLDVGVHWFMWRAIWSKPLGTGEPDKSWKKAFFFLDKNQDQKIDISEFSRGFYFYGWAVADIRQSVMDWREWLCVNYGYDRQMSWNVFSNDGTTLTREDWANYVWNDWFSSWSHSLKVPSNVSFDYLDTDKNQEITQAEFNSGYSPSLCVETTPGPGSGSGGGSSGGSSQSSQSSGQQSSSSSSGGSSMSSGGGSQTPVSSGGGSQTPVSSSGGGASPVSSSGGGTAPVSSAGPSTVHAPASSAGPSAAPASASGSSSKSAGGFLSTDLNNGLALGALLSCLCCVLPLGLLLCWSQPWKGKKKVHKRSAVVSDNASFHEEDSVVMNNRVEEAVTNVSSTSFVHQEQPASRTLSQPMATTVAPMPQPWWKIWTMYPAQTQFKYMALPAVEVPLPAARETAANLVAPFPVQRNQNLLLPMTTTATTSLPGATTVTAPLLMGGAAQQQAAVQGLSSAYEGQGGLVRSGASFQLQSMPLLSAAGGKRPGAAVMEGQQAYSATSEIRNLPVLQVSPGSPLADFLGRWLRQPQA